MKRYLFFIITLITSLLAFSCQDEDFGFTQEEIFKGAYERNFEAKYGKISPNETWDFSTYGRNNQQLLLTRAGSGSANADGWYYVEPGTINMIRGYMADGSIPGKSFGMLTSTSEFELIPVYQSGDADVRWTMNVMEITSSGTTKHSSWNSETWNKSERIQIKKGDRDCPDCVDGMRAPTGSDRCVVCDGLGKIPTRGGSIDCLDCVDGISGQVQCNDCQGHGYLGVCSRCGGNGFYNKGLLGGFSTVGCEVCGGDNKVEAKLFTDIIGKGLFSTKKMQEFLNGKKNGAVGSGHSDCLGESYGGKPEVKNLLGMVTQKEVDKCYNGTVDGRCATCKGYGAFEYCTACKDGIVANGKGEVCSTCSGFGTLPSGDWADLKVTETTADAVAIRTKPLTLQFDAGSVIYFNLEVTTGKSSYTATGSKTSAAGKMVLIDYPNLPSNINQNYEVKLIGCEESDTDKDYDDLVFLLVGHPRVPTQVNVSSGVAFTDFIEKRYLVEDLSSLDTWDFNDVVIDVLQTTAITITGNNDTWKLTRGTPVTYGTIRNLCGTLPIQIKVGTTTLNKISDPTNQEQSFLELSPEMAEKGDVTVTHNPYNGEGAVSAWDPGFLFPITGWTPQGNEIVVKVWKKTETGYDDDQTSPNTWNSSFPKPGEVPYIIATDITDEQNWPDEESDISTDSHSRGWWNGRNQTDYSSNKGNSSAVIQ